jgi:hypothetical protein
MRRLLLFLQILLPAAIDAQAPTSPTPAPPPAAATAPAPARTTPRTVAEIVQDFRDCLVFLEGGGGSGSGFICRDAAGTFLYTNQHVVAEMPRIQTTRLSGGAVKIGAGAAAVAHDIIRFATDPAPMAFELGTKIESFARIGDEVVVLGNGEGSRVITPLPGKLLGIGPDRIEVDSQFVPGNSGSPIVHVPSGKVIGIATYLTKRRFADLVDRDAGAVRRFGYRLDSVKQWQPVHWGMYQNENAELKKITALTVDFARFLDDLSNDGRLQVDLHRESGLGRIVNDLDRALSKQSLSAADRQRVLQTFVNSLRSATQADITAARSRLRYDFFLRQLGEEAGVRDEFYKVFDKAAKASLR